MQVFFNSPRHSCLLRTLSPHRGGLSNTHWLHRYHWHRHHWHRHHWHHRTSASPVSPRVAIPTFVFTYIIVACRSKSSSPPSSLAIYLFAFADPPPALLSAPSSLAYCPLLVLAARCCCNLLHMLGTSHIGTHGSHSYCATSAVTQAVTPQLAALISLVALLVAILAAACAG